MLSPEDLLDGQVAEFAPHVLVRNDAYRETPVMQPGRVVLRVEVLYTDHMATRISLDGRSYTIEDASMDDLLSLVDEVEEGLVSA